VIKFFRARQGIRPLSAGGELKGTPDANQVQQSRRYALPLRALQGGNAVLFMIKYDPRALALLERAKTSRLSVQGDYEAGLAM